MWVSLWENVWQASVPASQPVAQSTMLDLIALALRPAFAHNMDVVADSGVSADIGTTDFGLIFLMIVRLDRGQNVVVEIKIPVGIEQLLVRRCVRQ